MKKFEDKSGWIRIAVCYAVFTMHYTIRDVMLTALPIIAVDDEYLPNQNVTTISTSTESTDDIYTTDPIDNFTALSSIALLFDEETNDAEVSEILIHNQYPDPSAATSHAILKTEKHLESNTRLEYENSYKNGALNTNSDNNRDINPSWDGLKSASHLKKKEVKNDTQKERRRRFSPPAPALWEMLRVRSLLNSLEKKQPRKRDLSFLAPDGNIFRVLSGVSDKNEREDVGFASVWRYLGMKNRLEIRDGRDVGTEDNYKITYELTPEYSLSNLKEEWSLMKEGVVISSVYWGMLTGLLLSDLIINKLKVKAVLTISVGVGGLLGILTHAFSLGGPWVLVPFRIILGVAQGFVYPVVTRILQGIPSSARNVGGFVVYWGPILGSFAGVGIGGTDLWYIATYLMGAMAVPLIPLCLMLPEAKDKSAEKVPLKNLLKTKGVWACIAVNASSIFTLHTVLVGLPFCLAYTKLDQPSASGLALLAFVAVVGAIFRVAMFLSPTLSGKGPLAALNRRRIAIATGSIIMLIGTIVMATAGLEKVGVLVGIAIGLVGVGVSMTRLGVRLNLEDMAPRKLGFLTHVINITGIFVAIFPPLMVAGIAQTNEDNWVAIWLIPLALFVPSAIAYVFLLTTNSQLWDDSSVSEAPAVEATGMANGHGPPSGSLGTTTATRQSFKSARSGNSFKSAMTAQTFKTAVSRSRTRTMSCRTIDEDLSVDMRSVIDADDVHSVPESNDDCRSVASSNTFKSDGADMHSIDLNEPPEMRQNPGRYSGITGDRTSSWLNYHHQVPIDDAASTPASPPTKAEIRRKNAIYEIFW